MDNRITELRRRLDLSQEDLARRTGVSRQTINALERGRYEPRLALAFRLADALSCSLDELFPRDAPTDDSA